MNEKVTPEQAEIIAKALERELQAKGHNVTAQQLIPEVLGILNQLPPLISSLILAPLQAATTGLTGLLGGLVNILLSILQGSVGAGCNIAPQLFNIIQEQVPTPQQQQQQPTQQLPRQ